jgi:hypothetical protein
MKRSDWGGDGGEEKNGKIAPDSIPCSFYRYFYAGYRILFRDLVAKRITSCNPPLFLNPL